jgi:hypothetical protein
MPAPEGRCPWCHRRFDPGSGLMLIPAYRCAVPVEIAVGKFTVTSFVYSNRNELAIEPPRYPSADKPQARPVDLASVPFEVVDDERVRATDVPCRKPIARRIGRRTLVDVLATIGRASAVLHVKWECSCGARGVMTANRWQKHFHNAAVRGPYCEFCAVDAPKGGLTVREPAPAGAL